MLAYSVTPASLILNSTVIVVQKGALGAMVCLAPSNPTHATTILRLAAMVSRSYQGQAQTHSQKMLRLELNMQTRSLLVWKNL